MILIVEGIRFFLVNFLLGFASHILLPSEQHQYAKLTKISSPACLRSHILLVLSLNRPFSCTSCRFIRNVTFKIEIDLPNFEL